MDVKGVQEKYAGRSLVDAASDAIDAYDSIESVPDGLHGLFALLGVLSEALSEEICEESEQWRARAVTAEGIVMDLLAAREGVKSSRVSMLRAAASAEDEVHANASEYMGLLSGDTRIRVNRQ